MIGQTISHYKILEKLGEGGMGVVYKARDTKLDRDVALKFLPVELTKDADARERFAQEAKAASALAHPNVCTIHDIQEQDGQMFIVMEFVDGQTLREKRESLSFKHAIDAGIQIADGLAAAHEKGIVHRDIKPENIMIRKDGIVQIMDFGLAKLRGTVTRLTKDGSTVGTVAYMSPEQVQGLEADHRSDVFSLGILLYELFTGRLPFTGVHETALMYEIVNIDPSPMSTIEPDIDPELDRIVFECLQKEPEERYQAAKDISKDLRRFKRESSRQRASRITAARPSAKAPMGSRQETLVTQPAGGLPRVAWIVAALFFIGTVTFGVLYFERPRTEVQRIDSYVLPPEKMTFAVQSGGAGEGQIALSPDGSMLAFVAADSSGRTHLMVRRLNALDAKELPGTEEASYPFWSPDNRYIGFFESGKMKKIEASGGPPLTICDASDGRGGTWNQDGVILFSPKSFGAIYQVSATGGTTTPVTRIDSSHPTQSHRWPYFLPDGKHFLYFSRLSSGGVEKQEDSLAVASLDGKVERRLMPAEGNVSCASGRLIFLRERTLMAQPFDLSTLEVTADAIPIAERVEYDLAFNRAVFSISHNGMLIYQAGNAKVGLQLEWFDRNGKSLGKMDKPEDFTVVSLSPDGKKIAFDAYDHQSRNMDIWLYDIARALRNRFTDSPSVDQFPVWSPDGSVILFCSDRKGHTDLFQKTTRGAGVEEVLLESTQPKFPWDWSSNGKFIAYSEFSMKENLWILPLVGDRQRFVFLQTNFDEDYSQFSPDVHWIGYGSNESGGWDLYVRPFLGADGKPVINQTRKWQVSTNGVAINSLFRWNRNGKELSYLSSGNKLMAAEVRATGLTFDVGAVRPLFDVKGTAVFYDVAADGQKFLMGIPVSGQSVPVLTLVTNWDAALKKK